MHIHSFATAAASWQNFYLLVGTAAATLIGLMFVAVAFGAGLVTTQTTASARAFLDPPFAHFVNVLFIACLMVCPTMGPLPLAAVLATVCVLRGLALIRVYRRMREAHRAYSDIELSDWMMGIVLLPSLCYVVNVLGAAAFYVDDARAFSALAIGTVALLLLGVFGAWELMIWLALTRVRASGPTPAGEIVATATGRQ